MASESSFDNLQGALRRGDGEAAAHLFGRYAHRLLALARGHLHGRLRQKIDPEDVVQSVFRSFFRRCSDDPFEFDSWDAVWGLLVLLTLRKCGRRVGHFLAARRDLRREISLTTADNSGFAWDLPADEPTPAEAAMLNDLVERLMTRLSSERKRRIFDLSLQGYSIAEISAEVGYYERGVERVRAEIRHLLEEQVALSAEVQP
jgi:RNA polymerase sigma-70 factor (ECF subfamily)